MPISRITVVTSLPEAKGPCLFVPALQRFEAALRPLAGLLPIVDINGALIAALSGSGGRSPEPAEAIAGIFAADPFLDLEELALGLSQAGLSRAANYPTVQHIDGAAGEGLAAVGYDAAAEFAALAALEKRGFACFACVASPQGAELALGAGLRRLVFDPGPAGNACPPRLPNLAREAGAAFAVVALEAGAAAGGPQPVMP
jgi:predicted TIM-barrel enzyme